jgi:hypothetical protein
MKFQFDARLPHPSTAIQSVRDASAGRRAGARITRATALPASDTELSRGVMGPKSPAWLE